MTSHGTAIEVKGEYAAPSIMVSGGTRYRILAAVPPIAGAARCIPRRSEDHAGGDHADVLFAGFRSFVFEGTLGVEITPMGLVVDRPYGWFLIFPPNWPDSPDDAAARQRCAADTGHTRVSMLNGVVVGPARGAA